MSVSLYEQFLAVGAVKSLVTGKEYPCPVPTPPETTPAADDRQQKQSYPQNEKHR